MDSLEIAYILLRFPVLTETFVAEELQKVREAGVNVRIYSLLAPRNEPVHSIFSQLVPLTQYVPEIHNLSLWLSQAKIFLRYPDKYINLLYTLLKQPAPELSFFIKRLAIFLKSIWLAKEMENSSVQLVHTHFAWLSAASGMITSKLLDLPFTITTHAYDIFSHKNDLLKLTTNAADLVITISENNKRKMLEINKSLLPEKVEVVHCGIDLDYFKSENRNQKNEVVEITSVGSLLEKKGHEYLIRACSLLRTEEVNFHCVIVGSGELKDQLQKIINDLMLEKNIELVGKQTRMWVRERLRKSDLFVLTSVVASKGDRDGIPVALMEAMAMEIPVISTPISGIPELVRHNETGLLVPERNEHALARTIKGIIQDNQLRKKLTRQGRVLISKEYDSVENANRIITMFKNTVEGSSVQ